MDYFISLAIFHTFSEALFALVFLFVFIISAILLRPFRVHQKRKVSTISIKVSYLIYLLFLLIYAFLLLFYSEEIVDDELIKKTLFDKLVIISNVGVFIFPHITIMIRRRFRKHRVNYNWVCTLINVTFVLFIVFMLKITSWQF